MDHFYARHIKSESELHPVLMSEPAVCTKFYHLELLTCCAVRENVDFESLKHRVLFTLS
jgi:hypothetical protein